jgi:hypothetical protein
VLLSDTIDGMTFCWREGMQEWKRISDLPCLKNALLMECNETPTELNPDSIPVGKTSEETITRLPYDEVSSHLKYKDDAGRLQDFFKVLIFQNPYQSIVRC